MRLAKWLVATTIVISAITVNPQVGWAQVNPPREDAAETPSLSVTHFAVGLKNAIKRVFGRPPEFLSPVPMRMSAGINPHPEPIFDNRRPPGNSANIDEAPNRATATSPTEPPPFSPSSKSTGRVLGEKIDGISHEVREWSSDTNLLFALLIILVLVGLATLKLGAGFLKRKRRKAPVTTLASLAFAAVLLTGRASQAHATMTSSSFKIIDEAVSQGGGTATSGSFKLNQAIGQEFQETKTSASYKIYEGIMHYTGTLSITCSSSVSIPNVTPGTPQNNTDTCVITTDSANGYTLYTYENKDLENTGSAGTYITPSGLGSGSSPTPWNTGTDVGLGLSLSGASVQSKWDNGGNFASFVSGAAEEINTHASAVAGGTNVVITYQLDVTGSQLTGTYSNEVYYYVTTSFF